MAMPWKTLLPLLALPLLAQIGPTPGRPNMPQAPLAKPSPARLPLSFEENRGQAGARVKFLAHDAGHTLLLSEREATLRLARGGSAATTLRLRYLGANPHPLLEAEEPLPGKVNYFLGKDPAQWRTGVPTSARVRYRNLYPGTDLVYYGQEGHLEYDLVLRPGADPSGIRIRVLGADHLDLTNNGDVRMRMPNGELLQTKPMIFQERNGRRESVEGTFRLLAKDTFGLEVESYDHKRELVVDPGLIWSTYLGGNADEYIYSMQLDSSGNVIVAGSTASTNFPTTTGAFQSSYGGGGDAFVSKLSADGSTLLWSTYLGSAGSDTAKCLAIDNNGKIVIAGSTLGGFPTTSGAYQTGPAPGSFISKLSSDGGTLLWSTLLGGTDGYEVINAIALDSNGNAVVTGYTTALTFPTTAGAYQTTPGAHSGANPSGVFVSKVSADGSHLLWSTYLGNLVGNIGFGIDLDAQSNAIVVGSSYSYAFPTTSGAYQPSSYGSSNHGFVSKLSADGSSLLWSTFLGGTSDDVARCVKLDPSGSVFIGGFTDSSDFPVSPTAFQPSSAGSADGFVTKLSSDGSTLLWSSYLGGPGNDYILALMLDGFGDVLVAGPAETQFPLTPGAYQTTYGGGTSDGFIAKLSSDGEHLLWSTYLGGGSEETVYAIHLDPSGNVVLAGETPSTNFPTTLGAYQKASAGFREGFISKLVVPATGDLTASSTDLNSGSFTFTASPTSSTSPIQSVTFVLDGTPIQTLTTPPFVINVDSSSLSEAVHTLSAYATDSANVKGYMQPIPLPFTVDRIAPGGTVSSSLNLGTFTFTASPTDNLGPIQRVTFYLDGAFYKSVYAPPYVATCNGTALPDGTHTLLTYAVDGAGNLGYLQPKFLNFTVEHTPPTGAATVTGTSGLITFSATASDTSGIQRITFYVDGVFVASDYSAPYSITFDSTGLSNGTHKLLAYAMDNMGNLGYLTRGTSFTVNNTTLDSTPPTISNVFESGTTGTVVLSARATDDHIVMKVEFYVDGGLVGTDTSYFSPSGYSVPWASTPGGHTLVVKATDGAGNVGTSASYPFTTN